MAKFLTGEELNKQVYDIIWEAEDMLLIVSPFVKLDEYFKKIFAKHQYSHKLHLIIVFGKNESQPSKSLRKEDFEFFKQFKNVSIIYCSPLHAKYYANEKEGVLSSINLYDHSFQNNIEYGVYFPDKISNLIIDTAEKKAYQYTLDLMEQHPAIFIKRPVYEKKLLGKNYIESSVLYDATDKIMYPYKWNAERKRFIHEFPDFIDPNEYQERPEREMPAPQSHSRIPGWQVKEETGYCIRTGKAIPFNLNNPMSAESLRSWNQFRNKDYPEKFCHKTGKPSNGKTSMRNPILR
jgi:hypothetical protein